MGWANWSFLLIIFVISEQVKAQGTCPTGWSKWRDEKCFLLVATFSTYSDAKQACTGKGGLLANLKEEEQQIFAANYVFNESSTDIAVWIGATRLSATEFEWEDGTPFSLTYSNWGEGSPTDLDGRNCVSMQSKFSKFNQGLDPRMNSLEGTWKDVSCASPNYFLCETVPVWTPDESLIVLIETRKLLNETMKLLNDTRTTLNETRTSLISTQATLTTHLLNPVPVGFIYTQLPGQPEPQALWPTVEWTEITSQFAGKFFRALGGGSAGFGDTQNGDCPRLTQVRTSSIGGIWQGTINTPAGAWSDRVVSGDQGTAGDNFGMAFFVSNPEVRPVNTAVRIWVRNA